jgi:hypothetical protein
MENIFLTIGTAVITALLTTIGKSYFDRINYKNKLQRDLEFEQQRAVKNTISKYKGQLINSLASLHNRLKHIARIEGFEKLQSEYLAKDDEILKSTIYRFLSSFAWMHLINKELIHFDPTNAHEKDLVLLKFLRVLPLIFQDKDLENNIGKKFNSKSLIRRNTFEEMYKWLIYEKQIINYSEFLLKWNEHQPKINPLVEYFTNLNPKNESTKWDRIFTFHLLIMGFLNKFGYDFQKSDEGNMKKYIKRQGEYKMYENINKHLIKKFKLSDVDEVKTMMKIANYFKQNK